MNEQGDDARGGSRETSSRKHSRIVERSILHRGDKYDIELVRASVRDRVQRERAIVRHPGSVIILPLLEEARGRHVVFIRNYRVSLEQTLLELPAGTRARGEAPLACAARELEEETGYRAGSLVPLASFLTAPGLTDELMHAFVARGLSMCGQHLEADEDIEVELVPAVDAVARAARAEVADAKSALVLLLASHAGLIGGEH